MEEQFNKEAKQGCRFAADAARITDETASSDDREHTSGGVFVGVVSYLGAVVDGEDGAVMSRDRRKNRPCTGECQRRYARFCFVLLALDSDASENHLTSLVGGL